MAGMNNLSDWAHRALDTGPDGRTFCAGVVLIATLFGMFTRKLYCWRSGPVNRAVQPVGYWICIFGSFLLVLYLVWDSVIHPAI